MSRPPTVRRRALLLGGLAAVAGPAATACSSASPASPPSGVDELVVPTPSADPADFVAVVDNPWFPLAPGTRWTYRFVTQDGQDDPTGAPTDEPTGEPPDVPTGRADVVSVAAAGPDVGGVTTTSVRTVTRPPGAAPADVTDLYAQDVRGDVWWFGHTITSSSDVGDASWRAGDGGARAGLVVPTTPRLGDGFRSVLVPQVLDVRATVASLDGETSSPRGPLTDLLVIDLDDPLTSSAARLYYARGRGLVARQPLSGSGPAAFALDEVRPPS